MTKKTKPIKSKKLSKVSKEKPVILITNDDGVTAPGILNLVEAVKDLGKIVVVAPDKPQSGMGSCDNDWPAPAITKNPCH